MTRQAFQDHYNLTDSSISLLTAAGETAPEIDPFKAIALFIRKGDLNAFTQMLDQGYDVNSSEAKDFGSSLLQLTIRYDRREMFEILLQRNADINHVDLVGWTPLMECIIDDRPSYAQTLIEKGADLSIANKRGVNAMMLAQKFGKQEILAMMA